MRKTHSPLIAVLKTRQLEDIREITIEGDSFPDMIELDIREGKPTFTEARLRPFFRIGITDRRAFYREGVSVRISI